MSGPALLATAGSGLGPEPWVAAAAGVGAAGGDVVAVVGPPAAVWSVAVDLGSPCVTLPEHPAAASTATSETMAVLRSTERSSSGRLGVFVLGHDSSMTTGYRPMRRLLISDSRGEQPRLAPG